MRKKNLGLFGAAAIMLLGAGVKTSGVDSVRLAGDIAYDAVLSGGALFQSFDPSQEGPTGSPDPAALTSCPRAELSPGTHRVELTHEGQRRSYLVHVPAEARGPLPVVVSLHGRGSNAWQQELVTGMSRLADLRGFIVVYPESLDGTWNGGTCCSATPRDDVDFVRKVLEDVERKACVDARRVYVTGISNGGYMAYRLISEAPELFAAAAPVAAHLGLPEGDAPAFQKFAVRSAEPVPIIHFHGTADDRVEYDLTPGVDAGPNTGAPDTVAYFARLYGCDPTPVTTDDGAIVYRGADENAVVELYPLPGGGHCWPGNPVCWGYGEPMPEMNATQKMWDFFRAHVKPG
jgi:polyhydroxybutyrate depolymerase